MGSAQSWCQSVQKSPEAWTVEAAWSRQSPGTPATAPVTSLCPFRWMAAPSAPSWPRRLPRVFPRPEMLARPDSGTQVPGASAVPARAVRYSRLSLLTWETSRTAPFVLSEVLPGVRLHFFHNYRVKVTQLHPTLCHPMDYIFHGILQARILEWVAVPFSRGSSQPRDRTQVSGIAGRWFASWATRESPTIKAIYLPATSPRAAVSNRTACRLGCRLQTLCPPTSGEQKPWFHLSQEDREMTHCHHRLWLHVDVYEWFQVCAHVCVCCMWASVPVRSCARVM